MGILSWIIMGLIVGVVAKFIIIDMHDNKLKYRVAI
jgi:uncharacterized membrane protein YeaQ/YmgE (transglycosylase-associated protein family)